jgi:glycosyltransferase involved in cell wall biosynthesis
VTGVVVGDGPLRPELEGLARARGAANVRFLGARPRAERLMPAFDLLCLPSAWEGLGLVLVEGMLREVPVAGSRRGAIPEVLDGGQAGLLFEPTPEDLGATIDRALADRPALRALAARGRRHAERTFTVDAMVSGTRAVYERLG